MNKVLENKYPYLTDFFKTALEQNRLFHSLIFYGSNGYMQYLTALELARQLNCLEDGREDCNCQNCRWIRENRHPSVLTISKNDNKTDSSKTVISEEQINTVLDSMINSSDYHRVYIFCDSQIKPLSQSEMNEYLEYKSAGFELPQTETDNKIWYPSGINTSCFSTAAANSMLKSLEEPPSNVTFIFLTANKDDLLQTIVSRSQSFYIPDKKIVDYNTKFFEDFFVSYPNMKRDNALNFAQSLMDYKLQNDLESEYIIDCIQYYLTRIALSNTDNQTLLDKIFDDLKKTEQAKKMLNAYIKDQTVFEDLAFWFCSK